MSSILIVEDNEMNQDMLSRRLIRRGYVVDIARDAFEARRQIEDSRPDVILMDMGLPGIDGWQLTHELKVSSKTRSIPIIALTAHAVDEDRRRAFDVGCDEYESKPIEFDRLVEKIEALVQGVGE